MGIVRLEDTFLQAHLVPSNGAAAVGLRIQAIDAMKLVGRVVRTFAADAVAGFAFVVHHTADAFLHQAGHMVLALHILAFALAVVRAAIHRPSAGSVIRQSRPRRRRSPGRGGVGPPVAWRDIFPVIHVPYTLQRRLSL